jgi:hypothetical protein
VANKPLKLPARGAVLAALAPVGAPAKAMAWGDVRSCLNDALRGVPHQIVDLLPKALLVHTLDDAMAVAALRDIERGAARRATQPPVLRIFQLPADRDALHDALANPERAATVDTPPLDPLRLDEIMRGKALDTYRIEQPIWRFAADKTEIMGYAVRIDLDALAADLRLPSVAAGPLRAEMEALVAERLIGAYGHGRPGHRHRQFIQLPHGLLSTAASWSILEAKPVAALDSLVVELDAQPADGAAADDVAAVFARLSRLGFATSVTGIEWTAGRTVAAPAATWVRGKVNAAAPEQLSAALEKIGAQRAIAVVDSDVEPLERALSAGFIYGVGPAADALARERQIQQLAAAAAAEPPTEQNAVA